MKKVIKLPIGMRSYSANPGGLAASVKLSPIVWALLGRLEEQSMNVKQIAAHLAISADAAEAFILELQEARLVSEEGERIGYKEWQEANTVEVDEEPVAAVSEPVIASEPELAEETSFSVHSADSDAEELVSFEIA